MINVLGQNYYLDLNELDNFIQIKNEELTGNTETFSVIKFEVVKTMIEVIMTEREDEMDNNLGTYNQNKLSIPFKIAFNTLLMYNIEEREDLTYVIDSDNFSMDEFIKKLSNGIREELNDETLPPKKRLNDNERKVGYALIEILENWETAFESMNGGSKYNKLLLYYLIHL